MVYMWYKLYITLFQKLKKKNTKTILSHWFIEFLSYFIAKSWKDFEVL